MQKIIVTIVFWTHFRMPLGFQFILCLYTCLTVSDEPLGVLLVLVEACNWYS